MSNHHIRDAIRDAIATVDLNPPALVNSEHTVEFMYGKQADAAWQVVLPYLKDRSHDHGLTCRPEESLTCGLCGQTYFICKVCHGDVYGHHQECAGRTDA